MNEQEIKIPALLRRMSILPGLKGYPYLIRAIETAVTYYGQPFPDLKDLCIQTGEFFHVSPSIIMYDIRTLIRRFWTQKDSLDLFQSVLDSTISYQLGPKEFISVIAEYIALHR